MNMRHGAWILALLLTGAVALSGCDQPAAAPSAELQRVLQIPQKPTYSTITVQHKLGATVIEKLPQRVVALDMNEVDFLSELGIPVVGMPKDFVPHFLAQYRDAADVQDMGAIVQPNLERVYTAKPDLILITSLQANHYRELQDIAPTIHFDVDYRDSQTQHIEVIKAHLLTLGEIFGKQALAQQKVAELDAKVDEARRIIQGRPEKALIVLHNNGAFSAFGVRSRYGFVFDVLGVKPAMQALDTSLHGEPISSEFIQHTNPDVLYIVDRTAVMEGRPVLNADTLANPLLRQTRAWKTGRVIFADPDAWYITAASIHSVKLVIDDVIRGYQN